MAGPDQASRVARTASGTATLNTLGLGPLFVLATYHHPITRAKVPLPPHRWTLTAAVAKGGTVISSIGIESDADGVSAIFPGDDASDPATDWMISWAPILPSGVPQLGADRVVWVDVDEKQWVAAPEPAKLVDKEKRKRLVRLVAWESVKKVKSGGFETPPSAAKGVGKGRWDKEGLIEGVVLPHARKEHGKRADAWEIVVDHQWFFTYLVFRHYSLVKEKSLPVPPGLLVEAHDGKGKVVGGGVAVRTDGLLYVLHNRTQKDSTDLDYAFTTPVSTIIDLKADEPKPGDDGALGAPDKRMKHVTAVTGDIRTRYLLPFDWHTRGWDARITNRVAWTPAQNAAAPAIRTQDTTLAAPLMIHLDDTVLVGDNDKPLTLPDKSPVTVFDQLLKIINPLTAMPHVTDPLLPRNYLAAETYMCPDGTKVREWRRIIDHDGKLHDVQDRRLPGTAGTTAALGARVARVDAHPMFNYPNGHPRVAKIGTYELHLIDTMVDDWEYDEKKKLRLSHLLVYSSAFVTNVGAEANADKKVLENLDAAATQWNAGHPSNRFPNKPYAVVPEAGVKDGGPIVLARHFFGHRSKAAFGKLVIQVLPKVRANVNNGVMKLELGNESFDADTASDSDSKTEFSFVMAHEFGHVCGLPDEYPELLKDPKNPKETTGLPLFNQPEGDGGPARPFATDRRALMRANFLPRLRYLWHHVYSLNHEAAFSGLSGGPFVAEYRGFVEDPLIYKLPTVPNAVMKAQADASPWVPVGRKDLPNKRGELILYRLGPDESSAEALYSGSRTTTPSPLLGAIDGLLLVRTNYLFKAGPGATLDVAKAAAEGLLDELTDALGRPVVGLVGKIPEWYAVGAAAPLPLQNIGILFQPYFALGSAPSPPHVTVIVMPTGPNIPNDLALDAAKLAGMREFRVSRPVVGFCLLRLALGLPTAINGGGVNNAPIDLNELKQTSLLKTVSDILQDPKGATRTLERIS